jgi:hypothetical protein
MVTRPSAACNPKEGARKAFFFEKKNQKTFVLLSPPVQKWAGSRMKVFWFFSSEKNALLHGKN